MSEIKTVSSPAVTETIVRWYKRLGFQQKFDREFYGALASVEISEGTMIDSYDLDCPDGRKNLLSFLYMCEALSEGYAKKGIPNDILEATVRDILLWTESWSEVKGEMYLGELKWLKYHMTMRLFRLGRLQFCYSTPGKEYPKQGISASDGTLDVHIPADGKLDMGEVSRSFEMAKKFYAEYYPEARYTYFNCHSWLLDPTLKKYLSGDSNIIRFGDLFERVRDDESSALLRYIFRWDVRSPEKLREIEPTSGFSARIKEAALGGEVFHETMGIIKI